MSASTEKHRFQAGLPASVTIAGTTRPCEAGSLNRTGVLLTGRMPAPEEPEVELKLATARGDVELSVRARVLQVFPGPADGETRLAVEFVGLDAAAHETLESLINRVTENVAPAPLAQLPRVAPPKVIRAALEKIPVAHRINLAARAQVKERRFLREDTNLQVIEGLARNPNVSIQEIKEIARRHNILPSTVELIAEDRRWYHDEELKTILATHPRATLAVAEEVVGRMKERTAKLVVRKPGLPQPIKERLLARFTGKELTGW
jgi:hypothetical protein